MRLPAADTRAQSRIESGELLFQQIGCASCHVPKLILNDATHLAIDVLAQVLKKLKPSG